MPQILMRTAPIAPSPSPCAPRPRGALSPYRRPPGGQGERPPSGRARSGTVLFAWHLFCWFSYLCRRQFTRFVEGMMADTKTAKGGARADQEARTDGATRVTREQLISLLNEDLAREYQA